MTERWLDLAPHEVAATLRERGTRRAWFVRHEGGLRASHPWLAELGDFLAGHRFVFRIPDVHGPPFPLLIIATKNRAELPYSQISLYPFPR